MSMPASDFQRNGRRGRRRGRWRRPFPNFKRFAQVQEQNLYSGFEKMRRRAYGVNPQVGEETPAEFGVLYKAMVFFCIMLLVAVVMMFLNSAHIYAELGRIVGDSNAINWHNLGAKSILEDMPRWAKILLYIPAGILWLLARILRGLDVGTWGLTFICCYFFLQLFEVLPTIVLNSPRLLRGLILTGEQAMDRGDRALTVNDRDSYGMAHLKSEYSKSFDGLIMGLESLRTTSYIIDFIVCFIASPWLKNGWGVWQGIRLIFSRNPFNHLDLANIVRTLFSLFLIQVVVWLFMKTRVWLMRVRDANGLIEQEELTFMGDQPQTETTTTTQNQDGSETSTTVSTQTA